MDHGACEDRSELPLRVAFFGGSFDPPHVAHVLCAVYALSIGAVDRVLVAPVYKHPFGKDSAAYEHRLRMCELAFAWVAGIEVSSVERELGGESLTLRTLEHLRTRHPSWTLRLLIGSDVLADTKKWHRWDHVVALAEPLVVERPGSTTRPGALALADVSSTQVRAALRESRFDEVADRLPGAVLSYLRDHRLYERSRD
jgi:nicotinate-nucleotide adenylyltransferase